MLSNTITTRAANPSLDTELFWKEWGIDLNIEARGGIAAIPRHSHIRRPRRGVFCCSARPAQGGGGRGGRRRPGQTTGWIHRTGLKNKSRCTCSTRAVPEIDDAVCISRIGRASEGSCRSTKHRICAVRTLCASCRRVWKQMGRPVHLIGGADVAAELDCQAGH